MVKLYNTLKRKKETLKPIKKGKVGLYACGPTVYWYAHIGNLRTYVFEDVLRRTLEYNDYRVKHVVNITDVGHLTSDADTGEDKIEKGARREKKTAWEIAEYYADAFRKDIEKLNIKSPSIWTKATDYIKEQIELIQKLEKKGFTYLIEDGLYFDTSKLKSYGRLWGKKKVKIKAGVRVKMAEGKKNPTDFALWKLTSPGTERQMEWDSPWGRGFPGWHTECVAMAAENLGLPFDIHCGGIDHVQIHHSNEIAQAEGAYGKVPARFWMHGEFLNLKKEKMAKSEGNILTVNSLIEKGFDPLAYRYLCLMAHYRSRMDFSWKSLEGAQNGLNSLRDLISGLQRGEKPTNKAEKWKKEFLGIINDDLNTPKVLAFLRKTLKSKELSQSDKYNLAIDFDRILGLNLGKEEPVPEKIKEMAEQREVFRKTKDWKAADEARKKIEALGYRVEDTKEGPKIKKKS